MATKTVSEINERIRDGSVSVLTAEEMTAYLQEHSAEEAVREVDVVTTGTFGAMCSSGVFLNFGNSDPPIRMQRVHLNDVEAYTSLAAVDAYIGATAERTSVPGESHEPYGGGHVIEDLIAGKEIDLHAESSGTDCYPRRMIDTRITIDDLNQAVMVNPRNAYQRYDAATNSTKRVLYTYMGTLLPEFGNVTYSGAGVLSPLSNDPTFRTIGTGTRIFLGGAQGYVIGSGTQHDPDNRFGTMMTCGDLRGMDAKYVRGAAFHKYGISMYVGVGVPIPILDEEIAAATGVSDSDLTTEIVDYGIPRRSHPMVREVTYEELRSGIVDIDGKEVRTSSLSSFNLARAIADELKRWIGAGEFFVSAPASGLPVRGRVKPMRETAGQLLVQDAMSGEVRTINMHAKIRHAAELIIEGYFNHLPVLSEDGTLIGIVTSWDISRAVARGDVGTVESVMSKNVVTSTPDEFVELAVRKMEKHKISALPVIDQGRRVIGMVTSGDLNKLLVRR
ncbi:MAG TPA: CBS domain-containing protein [Methanosarcinales archaeon]|nr:CBS domain-containing protein [Methanosarcinales archaeon]